MISKNEKQTELEFGKGDICIAGGYYKDKDDKNVGLVTFINQKPREIGQEGITKANQEHKVGDFPVIMTFTKSESIDVVIDQLKQAKAEMTGEQEKPTSIKFDITKTDVFKTMSDYIGKLLNDERISNEIRCEWFNKLMNDVSGLSDYIEVDKEA